MADGVSELALVDRAVRAALQVTRKPDEVAAAVAGVVAEVLHQVWLDAFALGKQDESVWPFGPRSPFLASAPAPGACGDDAAPAVKPARSRRPRGEKAAVEPPEPAVPAAPPAPVSAPDAVAAPPAAAPAPAPAARPAPPRVPRSPVTPGDDF